MSKFTNKLIGETSPYLLQHAHNPVDWYPWGEEALKRARDENKPILVSIGYSACHWCHVMEKESFEDEETAAIMNENFINIKIDREERPDLDHVYMDAVQAMTGSGGWPLNVFLTPDCKPFYGGTYFPPRRAFNRPSWQEILWGVAQSFRERRHEIDAQAENLTEHLIQSNSFGQNIPEETNFFAKEKTDETFQSIMKSADKIWGGFSRAPKFPQSFVIQYLIRFGHLTGNEEALKQALLSLDKMIDGGIYDQAGGGFARYSTDTEWLVPHFEKMLYDNALLVSVISEAYQVTGEKRYREVIVETIEFLIREMMHPEGGFYSALDADSEGVEGKFYVWNAEEVEKILKEDASLFCEFFDITAGGNWSEGTAAEETKNILRRKIKKEDFCKEKNISLEKLDEIILSGKKQLLEKRKERIRPQTDDKILLGWNALTNLALCKAFEATGDENYRQLAEDNMRFLLTRFAGHEPGEFFHSWKNEKAKHPAFLDDYAFLIQAMIRLQEITGDANYLLHAKKISEYVIENFSEPESGMFLYTKKDQSDVIVRKKEVYDGAQPSGNAVMADNLYRLSLYFDLPEWRERSNNAVSALGNAITRYPASFGAWACLMLEITAGTNEIAIMGTDAKEILIPVLREYIPHRVLMIAVKANDEFPLLSGKIPNQDVAIFLCRNYACSKPVNEVKELMQLIGLNN